MRRRIVLGSCLGLVAAWAGGARAQVDGPLQMEKAQGAAERWLGLIDRGEYVESWDQASRLFQRSVARDAWPEAAARLHAPLGDLVSRRFSKRQYSERLQGVPAGQYLVVSYTSEFERRNGVEERVTVVLDGARGWRVSGYTIP